MEIFKKAEDNGFVHQITNIDGEQKIFGICNCNVNVCNALRTSQLFNTPNMSRSAYVARRGDGEMRGLRPLRGELSRRRGKAGAEAVHQGRLQVQYPRQELPDEVKWGPEKWDASTTGIRTASTATTPAPPPARPPVPHTSPCRAT